VRIENTELRRACMRAVQEGRATWQGLATEVGLIRNTRSRHGRLYVCGDGTGLRRRLGVVAYSTIKYGRRYTAVNMTIDYDLALKLAEAVDLDPVDVGL
jgi:hypothetical protein